MNKLCPLNESCHVRCIEDFRDASYDIPMSVGSSLLALIVLDPLPGHRKVQ